MALDATPKSVTGNAYCTRAEAVDYFTSLRPGGAVFLALAGADQDKYIIWATALLDSMVDWFGSKRTVHQRLRWPREFVIDPDGQWMTYDTYPDRLVYVTAETANILATNPARVVEPSILGQGIGKIDLDVISITVDPSQILPLFPPYLVSLLSVLGNVKPDGSGGDRVIPLVRA